MRHRGNPCWFELATTELEAAQQFYSAVLGWQIDRAPMEGFDYRLARAQGQGQDGCTGTVAGLMSTAGQAGAPPASWLIYFAADDCDAAASAITAAGGSILKPPADIPGTGRFAVAADPQGAAFGIPQPDMSAMSPEDSAKAEAGGGAFDQAKAGHGNWLELMSSDPAAGFAFYSGLFGWTKGQAMDMGAMGTYQLFADRGRDIGGMMGLGPAPTPFWTPYFGVNGVEAAIARITKAGGSVHHGPAEVPGGAFIASATDPQGAWFAVVGPREVTP